ncbi:hypothetical protein [Aliidiomarina sp.]|uniref:hypothetical protein n=1 Tax=Aliidiomarina sp. TaxID=1872439 RepID=UPI003A4E3BEB
MLKHQSTKAPKHQSTKAPKHQSIKTVLISLIAGTSFSALAVDRELECSLIANQITSVNNGYLVAPGWLEHRTTINTGGPIYAAVGETFQVRGRKTNFCIIKEIEDLAGCLWEYATGNSNRYAWWENNAQHNTNFLGGFSSNRNLYYVPTERGEKSIVSVVTDKYYTTNSYGSTGNLDLLIPSCDAIKVYAHDLPIANAYSLQGGMSISAQAVPTIDSLSERGRQGLAPIVSWRLKHIQFHEADYFISGTTTLNFSPQYNGIYTVYLTVGDGNYSTTTRVGDAYFAGGEDGCFDCDTVIIQ